MIGKKAMQKGPMMVEIIPKDNTISEERASQYVNWEMRRGG
jgi:hypothetical protein